jgi:RNA polymerase sigma factor (sigma-70 family)
LIIDSEIVTKIQEQDRKVVLALYQHTFNVLMSAAVRYKNNREDQMDIVNTAFMKIVTGIHHYKVGTAYFSWAKQIVSNTIIDDFRKNKNYKALFEIDSEVSNYEEADVSDIDEQIEAEAVQAMLDTLPPATKMVFNLYAIEGYSSKEICKDLDIGYETVKWHIKEARKRLRKLVFDSQVIMK